MSLNGSRIVDEQRRRRMVMDAEPVRSNVTPVRPERGSSDELSLDHSPLTLVLTQIIPSQVWKFWTVASVTFATMFGLLLAWLVADNASLAGSRTADLLVATIERFVEGTGVVAWCVAAQLCCLAWWIRSTSRSDYGGRFHTWGWSALTISVAAVCCLTNAQVTVAQLTTNLLGHDARSATSLVTAIWLLPSLVIGLVWWTNLSAELRGHMTCRILHGLSGVCGLTLAAIELGAARTIESSSLEVVSRVTLVAWQWCCFATVLLHVRHLVHVSQDPPEECPTLWGLAWARGPGRMWCWWIQRRQRTVQRLAEERRFAEEVSASPGKRYLQLDDQEVRIDDAEEAAKGPSRRVRQRVRS